MTANNKQYKTDKRLSDFDAVSLYPSAMKRIWYPTGNAKTLTEDQIQYYNNKDNLFKITEY